MDFNQHLCSKRGFLSSKGMIADGKQNPEARFGSRLREFVHDGCLRTDGSAHVRNPSTTPRSREKCFRRVLGIHAEAGELRH
jgi:hypothetical protein